MKAVVQRVKTASVIIKDGKTYTILNGLVVFLGICNSDSKEMINPFVNTILNAKIFEGENGHFSNSVIEKKFEVLVVSQFTLFGELDSNSFISFPDAAKPSIARELYKDTIKVFQNILGDKLKTGSFGAYMNVYLDNDGPVTLIL